MNDDVHVLRSQQFWWLYLAYRKICESPKSVQADSASYPPPLFAIWIGLKIVRASRREKAELKSYQCFHEIIFVKPSFCYKACSNLFVILLVYHLIPLVVVGKTPTLLIDSFFRTLHDFAYNPSKLFAFL